VLSLADLVHEAKQIASSGPQDRFLWQTKASQNTVNTSSSERISKLRQSKTAIDDGIALLNDKTNM